MIGAKLVGGGGLGAGKRWRGGGGLERRWSGGVVRRSEEESLRPRWGGSWKLVEAWRRGGKVT